MKVTNSGTAPRGVYLGGTIKMVLPGASRDLALKGDDLVQARKIPTLSFEETVKPEADEKAALFAKLKDLGVDAAGNSKLETLRKKLEEAELVKAAADAEAAQKQEVIDQLTTMGVDFDVAASLVELQAVLASAKA